MTTNALQRYLFEDLSIRGELVQLTDVYHGMVINHQYPEPVKKLLGELLASTALLTATLKFEGSITLQLQGDGPVSLVVINGDNQQNLRGVARFDGDIANDATLKEMMGKGYLVITISPDNAEPYQGIVGIEKDNLADVLENYFAQSEQLKTKLWLKTDVIDGQHFAGGMLLQILPSDSPQDEDFDRLEALTSTLTSEELFGLDANTLLYRLYNEETVHLLGEQSVQLVCGCSVERSKAAILMLSKEEIEEMLSGEESLNLHCDYCGSDYTFTPAEINELFIENEQNKTLH